LKPFFTNEALADINAKAQEADPDRLTEATVSTFFEG
jgi:hypothetical protein